MNNDQHPKAQNSIKPLMQIANSPLPFWHRLTLCQAVF
jgi:hypothetical protein